MGIFEKNLQALDKAYPDLAKTIRVTDISTLHLFESENGMNVYSQTHDAFYYHQNISEHVEQNIQAMDFQFARIVAFLSIGLGYEVLRYRHQYLETRKTLFLIIVEENVALFKMALQISDLSELILNKNVGFFIGYESNKLFAELSKFVSEAPRVYYVKSLQYIVSGKAFDFNNEYYLKAMELLRESIAYTIVNNGNDLQDSLIGLENMFLNIDEIIKNPGINLLYEQFKGTPAIIASAGPSLVESIELLKKATDKALIITPDTSLKILLNHGVKPHIFVCHERTDTTAKYVENIEDELIKDVQFLSCPVIAPRTYDAYAGPKMIMYRAFNHFKWLEIDKGTLVSKQSAGNMSFKVAEALGCDPIILIGQDLAFGEGGKTHAQGAVSGDKQSFYDGVTQFYVKGNYQEQVRTTVTWYKFLKGYEQDVADSKATCINSTAGGAYIDGTIVMPFEESYMKYLLDRKPMDFPRLIKELTQNLYLSQPLLDEYKKLEYKFIATQKYFQDLFDQLKQGQKLVEDYLEHSQRSLEGEKTADSIAVLKNQILMEQVYFQQLISHVAQPFLLQFEMEIAILEKDYSGFELLDVYIRRQGEWFDKMMKISERIYDIILKSQTIIKSKLAE